MLFSVIFLSLLPFFAIASEDSQLFEEIYQSVKAVESREPTHDVLKEVCYPDIGCFTDNGLLGHIGSLPSSPESINTRFFAYTQESPNAEREISAQDYAVVPQNKPIVFIAHGFGNDGKADHLLSVKNALIKEANIPTVVMVDWAKGAASPWYDTAARNTEVVGRQIAFLVETLRTQRNVDPNDVHLIGYSLGAQVSGFAGKFSQSQYKWKFGRISALDSAAPLFEKYPGSYLTHDDAIFVDALHTSAGDNVLKGEMGFIRPIGHVDFYPHDGKAQPRCKGQIFSISCNHASSVYYFEASLSSTNSHCSAYKCNNWADFVGGKCPKEGESRTGYYSISTLSRGVHYSEMKKDYPFCQN